MHSTIRHACFAMLTLLTAAISACHPSPGHVKPRMLTRDQLNRQDAFFASYRSITRSSSDCLIPDSLNNIAASVRQLGAPQSASLEIRRDIVAHDCQRLIDDVTSPWPPKINEKTYFGVVAALATASLDSMTDDYFVELNGRGARVAVLVNSDRERGYKDLDIEPNRAYCAYLGLQSDGDIDDSRDWWAAMHTCDSVTIARPSRRLEVRRETIARTPPPVVVFHWESSGKENSLGIRCGSAWCSISKDRPRPHSDHGMADEQYLALRKQPNQPHRIADLHARLSPIQASGNIDDYNDKWVPVAQIDVRAGDARDYLSKLNVGRGLPSRVFLRRKTDAGLKDAERWIMKVVRGDSAIYRHVKIHENPGHVIIGSARWRWIDEDEQFWTSCIPGCCEMTDSKHPPLE
jgi:hypothetical protein